MLASFGGNCLSVAKACADNNSTILLDEVFDDLFNIRAAKVGNFLDVCSFDSFNLFIDMKASTLVAECPTHI